MAKALIDADVLAYTVGFAAQKILWEVQDEGICVFADTDKNKCLTYVEDMARNLDVVPVIIPDELRNALHTTKQMIKKITAGAGCNQYACYLTGKGNFRERIATLQKYKGNRVAAKPYHFESIRQYLIERHKAIVCDGMEADDGIAIVHTRAMGEGRRTVICSVDKDFDQIVGPHYYFKKDSEEYYEISPTEANKAFWLQLLTGDRTDNILGIEGCGTKTAQKILSGVEVADYERVVLKAYRAKYGDFHKYYHWKDVDKKIEISATPEALMIENARLLYLLREKPENGTINLWRPSWQKENEAISLKATEEVTESIAQD